MNNVKYPGKNNYARLWHAIMFKFTPCPSYTTSVSRSVFEIGCARSSSEDNALSDKHLFVAFSVTFPHRGIMIVTVVPWLFVSTAFCRL